MMLTGLTTIRTPSLGSTKWVISATLHTINNCLAACATAKQLAKSAGASPHVCFAHDKLVLQNQIKSEEQFQAKKSELRSAALERLETIFDKKGKVRVRGRNHLS